MIARLIMVLMLAFVSLPHGAGPAPAASACHEATAMPMHHQAPAPATPAPAAEHGCIGCIPPGDWLGARVAAPAIATPLPPSASVRVLPLGSGTPPALPPPRIA